MNQIAAAAAVHLRRVMHHTLTADAIAEMVDTFYLKVRRDDLIGPIFNAAISDWEPHLARMKAFWASVLLASGSYRGNPMITHLELPRLSEIHFERWLQLWEETAGALCSPQLAQTFVQRARAIGARLLEAITLYHGETLAEAR